MALTDEEKRKRKERAKKRGEAKEDEIFWAYVAGFIEGDGCLSMNARYQTSVALIQSDRGVLDWLCDKTRLGVVSKKQNKTPTIGDGISYHWRIRGAKQVIYICERMINHLKTEKRDKAVLLMQLAVLKSNHRKGTKMQRGDKKQRGRILRDWELVSPGLAKGI